MQYMNKSGHIDRLLLLYCTSDKSTVQSLMWPRPNAHCAWQQEATHDVLLPLLFPSPLPSPPSTQSNYVAISPSSLIFLQFSLSHQPVPLLLYRPGPSRKAVIGLPQCKSFSTNGSAKLHSTSQTIVLQQTRRQLIPIYRPEETKPPWIILN